MKSSFEKNNSRIVKIQHMPQPSPKTLHLNPLTSRVTLCPFLKIEECSFKKHSERKEVLEEFSKTIKSTKTTDIQKHLEKLNFKIEITQSSANMNTLTINSSIFVTIICKANTVSLKDLKTLLREAIVSSAFLNQTV